MVARNVIFLFVMALCRKALSDSCNSPIVETSMSLNEEYKKVYTAKYTTNCHTEVSQDYLLENHGLSEFGGETSETVISTSTHTQTVVSIDIVRNDFEGPNPDGSYKWAVQTGDGIFHEQRGSIQTSPEGKPGLVVEGQYQYTAPDGQVINLLYRADENGVKAQGAHLPTPPPIPPAIQRSLDYLATKAPSYDYN